MTPEDLRARLKGIAGFGVTPFHADFSLNMDALRRNAAPLAEVRSIFVRLGVLAS